MGVRVARLLLVIATFVGLASPPAARADWAERLARRWEELSPRERDEAVQNYRHYQRLSPEGRRTLEENYQRWQQLPSPEKDRLRDNYRRYRQLSPDERREYDRRYERWKHRR
jgi:hypothetical protein